VFTEEVQSAIFVACRLPASFRTFLEDAAWLQDRADREWLRGQKQDPAEGGTSAGSTDLHSGLGSFGGCYSHSGTA
jgi:hypothetical protein